MKRKRIVLGLIVFMLVVFVAAAAYYSYTTIKGMPSLGALTPLSLEGYQRLLILAPHCDDETLGSAGVIQAALRLSMDVRVVIATNGDGFLFATMDDFHRIYPTHTDFIRMGKLRQGESQAAMQTIGLRTDQVIFLSYPDRGTPALWNDNWLATNPFRSPYSGDTQSPYPLTYNPNAVYAGEDYLADLRGIIASYRPDLIIYPHPNDAHPDHWGLSAFTRLAIAWQERDDPAFRPDTYAYLVHRPDFPIPKGLLPNANLLPPTALYSIYPDWFRWDLSPEDVTRKNLAVNQYKSQLPLLRGLMVSFVRQNELFAQPQSSTLPYLVAGDPLKPDTWQDAAGNSLPPVQKDPVRDLTARNAFASADLVAVYAARTPGEDMVICAQLRGEAESSLRYFLRILAVDSKGIVHRTFKNHPEVGGNRLILSGNYFCGQATLADLGDPWLIFLGAEVEEVGTGALDQIAWQQVKLEPISGSGK